MKPLPINEKLVWDYDIPEDAQTNEAFREWYIARVLTRGSDNDLRTLGFGIIHDYFPRLILPARIREFWEWYFALPELIDKYGYLNTVPKADSESYWR